VKRFLTGGTSLPEKRGHVNLHQGSSLIGSRGGIKPPQKGKEEYREKRKRITRSEASGGCPLLWPGCTGKVRV